MTINGLIQDCAGCGVSTGEVHLEVCVGGDHLSISEEELPLIQALVKIYIYSDGKAHAIAKLGLFERGIRL